MSSSSDDNYSPENERKKRDKERKKKVQTKNRKEEIRKKKVIKKKAKVNVTDTETFGLGTSHEGVVLPTISDLGDGSCLSKERNKRLRKQDDDSDDPLDEDYKSPEEYRRFQRSQINKKCRSQGNVIDNSTQRTSSLRQTRYQESITPSVEGFHFPEPVICPTNVLGDMTNECFFCAALHFPGRHICCLNGKVFIPPLPKLPEPLHSLLHGCRTPKSNKFLENIITYNANFSFGSTQYTRNPVAKFGVQAIRSRGAVNHYSSAALPHTNRDKAFGNVYVYRGNDAVAIRMDSQFSSIFDREVVEDLQQMIEEYDPLAAIYFSMGQKIDTLKASGENVESLRLKIVDPSNVDPHQLQAHPGVYGKPESYKDYVALFYTSSVDQQVNLPGYIVYPKHDFHISRPIFAWSDLINPLCYPLLFPRGERGWGNRKYPYCPDRLNSKQRLEQYAALHRDEAALWDTPFQPVRHVSRVDSNVEDSGSESSEEDDNMNDDAYNAQVHQVEEHDEEEDEEGIIFEERGGVMYPTRIHQITGPTVFQNDDLIEDSGDEGQEDDEIVENITETVDSSDVQNLHLRNEEDEQNRQREIAHRKYASFRESVLYQMQQRRYFKNRFTASGKLGQLHLIDNCTRLFKSRSDFIQKHHTEFMSSTRKKFLEAYQRRIDRSGRKIGYITSIPSSVPGSPRYMQKKYEDVVALANEHGAPDLFITFTANVNWPEIKSVIEPGKTWADYPLVVNEVFWKKFEVFQNTVLGEPVEARSSVNRPGLFGKVKWWSYAIEFQQRGPPHVHMIVSLVDHIRTSADVDKICQATIPPMPHLGDENYEDKVRLRKLVCDLMIHSPCEKDPEAYCQKNKPQHWKTCKKHFPKEWSNETHFGDLTYPDLKRPNDGSFVMINRKGAKPLRATNQYVVPYNTQLLTMFESHINVEVISALRSVKYIFKYEFKGYDRTLVETITSNSNQVGAGNMTMDNHIMYPKSLPLPKEIIRQRNIEARKKLEDNNVNLYDENGQHVLVYDETHFVEDLRSLTSCESGWEFAGYPRTDCSHQVVTVFVHQPHEEPIQYPLNTETETFERLTSNPVPSRLKAWFELNQSQDLLAQTLFFHEIPKHYRYVKDHWRKRKIRLMHLIGRTKAVHPRNKELYAIRLLSSNRTNITSFESLRTVNGEVFPTFVGAAKELNLMNDHREWDLALTEAARDKMPIHLRRLFASILLFCAPEDPLELWNDHKENLYENKSNWSQEVKEAHALHHIESILKYHGSSLQQQNLPMVNDEELPPIRERCTDGGSMNLPPNKAERIANDMYNKMTAEQKNVFNTVVQSVTNNDRRSFFINGSGGCGKTFVYNALCRKLSVNHKVLCVAHTGIAAILLPGGRTSHRAFRIPLTTEDNMHCKVNMEDDIAVELAAVDVVLWDEATMSDRRILESVNRLMCALHPNDSSALFGGVPFIFGGDWKQTLPILKEVRGAGILEYTMLRSQLWENIKILQLTRNMRALEDPEYSNFLMNVGFGMNKNRLSPEEDQKIDLPTKILAKSEQEVIDFVFGNGQLLNSSTNAAILTADNASSMTINEEVLKMLPGEKREYKSIDSFDENSGFSILDTEVYNQLTPKGMPPHKLNLKVGAIVMLLRNLNTDLSLCNGTRLRILKLGERVLTCEPIVKDFNSPDVVYIPRMVLSTSIQATSRDLAFHRFQFPIRLSYAMTIHKSQGQTLSKVGVILRTPVFAHGQLYVALSRVRSANDIRIFNISSNNPEVTNVVYKSIFPLI